MTDTPPLDPFLGFLDDDRIELPPLPSTKYPRETGGKVYFVEQPDSETGSRLAALGQILAKMTKGVDVSERDVARLNMSDGEEMEFQSATLGDTLAEMIADGVNHNRLKIAANYVFVSVAFSEGQARKLAEAGQLTGKAVPSEGQPNRAARRGGKGKSKNPAKAATT